MHIEFLIEDPSGGVLVQRLVDSWLPQDSMTRKYRSFKGIGGVMPKRPGGTAQEIASRSLFDNLGRMLAGYGNQFEPNKASFPYAIVVVCDLDRRNRDETEANFSR